MEGSNPSLEWDELELKTSQVYLCMQLHMGGWMGMYMDGFCMGV